ncbi:MAG: Ig-like domain-containing protein, partial [Angustibacter sp.]
PGFTGATTPLTYQVKDIAGTPTTSTITVTVTAVTPVPKPDTGTTPFDTNIAVDPLLNDIAGATAPLDKTSVLLKDPADGTLKKSVTIPGEGTYTVDPITGKVTFDPLPTFSGVAKPVTYQVTDANGTKVTSTITITVSPAAPPKAVNDNSQTPFQTPVTLTILGNDSPGTSGVPLDPTSVLLKDPADGTFKKTVTIPGEGTYSVDPTTGKVTFAPTATFSGVTTPLTYQIKDQVGGTATALITVTVLAPPKATPDVGTTPQNTNITIDPLVNDTPGGSPLDPTSVKLKDPADGTYKSTVTIPGEGSYTVDPITGKVTFDPLPTFTGTATPVTYLVKDTAGTSVTSTITITVGAIVPTAKPDAGTTPKGTAITVPILGNDSAGAAGVPLVPSTVKLKDPADGTFKTTVTIPGEGTYVVQADGQVKFTPEPTFTGTAKPVTYQVADANGTPTTSTITITVTDSANPAAIPDTTSTLQGKPVTIDPLINDVKGGTPLDPTTVKLVDPATGALATTVTIPGEGTYKVDPVTGKVTFTPLPGFTGTATPVKYQVTDQEGKVAKSTISVTVAPVVPVALPEATSTPKGVAVTLDVLGNDSAGAPGVPLDPTTVLLKDPADGTFKKSVTIPGEGTYVVDPSTG